MAFIAVAIFTFGLLGLIPAAIAHSKERSFFGWWLYGTCFFFIAIIHVLFVGRGGARRKCPFCAEIIRLEAIVCPHCQREVPTPSWALPQSR